MQIGLLWYDRDPKKTVVRKIEEAAERYVEKYGRRPDTCHVNPRDHGPDLGELRLVANPLIQPNTFWIGQEEATIQAVAPAPPEPRAARRPARERAGTPIVRGAVEPATPAAKREKRSTPGGAVTAAAPTTDAPAAAVPQARPAPHRVTAEVKTKRRAANHPARAATGAAVADPPVPSKASGGRRPDPSSARPAAPPPTAPGPAEPVSIAPASKPRRKSA